MAWVPLVLAAASAATSVIGGVQVNKDAKADSKQLKRIGEIEADDFRRETARLLASQQVAFAAAGVDASLGTPLDVLGDAVAERELQALRIRYGRRSQAGAIKRQGKLARIQGGTQGLGTILGGANDFFAAAD